MCGICGQYNFDNQQINENSIRGMCALIRHRGPDDEGIYLDGSFGMGMRRLSIIDLDTGHQPISNEDDSIWTILNGEIYNYIELAEDLKKKGHIFKTKSDTEVLVHLYEEYGYSFVKLLRGMFGLAIWDKKKRELILARDPLGIKQLYFFKGENKFVFGSEIKCILKSIDRSAKVNIEALGHYLTFLYFPDNLTIFDSIEKIRPGNLLKIKTNTVELLEYWNLDEIQKLDIGFAQAQEEFLKLMRESMNLHLRSDVPLGVFLSGGIDSSIVTALASQLTDRPLNTFTIGYNKEGNFYDERDYARIVSRLFKTNHHEYVVNPDIGDTIYKLIYYFDEPFANSSAIPNYYISQMMRKEVKVALSGLGGDEICAGYERTLGMKLLISFNRLPKYIKNIARGMVDLFPDSNDGSYFSDRIKRFMRASDLSAAEAYYSIISAVSEGRKKLIFTAANTQGNTKDKSYEIFSKIINKSRQSNIIKAAMYFDLVSYTANDLLVLADRTSMANSLEVRVPFLDHKLVEFMFQLPVEFKINGFEKKYLFKKVFKNVLPRKILYRKKRGFSTPLSVWLRNDLQGFSTQILTKERIKATEYLDFEGTRVLLNEHMTRQANHQGIIFALLTFVIWHEIYIQNKKNNLN
jgi:asparagine synthase (glutamine-hydrolysing)